MNETRLTVGARVRFDGKSTLWLARAATSNGRYVLLTSDGRFGRVYYTIIDFKEDVRGSLNVIGGGLGIFTKSGPDENIDDTISMLESDEGWEVSHRSRVPLVITEPKAEGE